MVRGRGARPSMRASDELDDLFTNRVAESVAFAEALTAHRRRLDDEVGEEEPTQGRNLLVFHGHGGLGKSELSRRLEAWACGTIKAGDGWATTPSTAVDCTARIDLHRTRGNVDGAELLAQLRIRLGELKESWPIFDVAFAGYWAATHPGEALPVIVDDDASRAFRAGSIELLGALAEDLGAGALVATLGVGVVKRLVSGVSSFFGRRLQVQTPDDFDELLLRLTSEPTPDSPRPELLGELASLLTYELDHWEGPVPMVVVFIDTFERLDLDARREGAALLNRVAWCMDNVLFVVTGRNRLDWWETTGTPLARRGPSIWPLLTPGAQEEPRQHALEYLSDHDRRILLGRIRAHFDLPMTDDVLDSVAETSGGLPEHIRLAQEAMITLHANGLPITVSSVPKTFDDLVLRLLEDIPSEGERRAVFAATLFPECDPLLIRHAAGVDEAVALRALTRPLFTPTDGVGEAHAIHDKVRAAIRHVGPLVEGGWSESDWREAGTRALAHLRERYGSAVRELQERMSTVAAGSFGDARAVLRLTGLAISVLCDVEADVEPASSTAYADWVSEAMVKGPSTSGLRPFIPSASRTIYGSELIDFVLAKSTWLPGEARLALLRRLAESSPRLGWLARRHLGYTLRNQSRWDEALDVFGEMLEVKPHDVLTARQWVATFNHARRYTEERRALERLGDPFREGAVARLARSHGKAAAWVQWTGRRAEEQVHKGLIKDALETEGAHLRWYALAVGPVHVSMRAGLRVRAEESGHDIAMRDSWVVDLLSTGEIDPARNEAMRRTDVARNDGEMGFRTAWVRAAAAYHDDDVDALTSLHADMLARRRSRGDFWVPVEHLLDHLGLPVNDPSLWLEPRQEVVDRWARVWSDWRSRLAGTSGHDRRLLDASSASTDPDVEAES
ncbi:hypothetical protein [Cellulosimicrobium cellulans]|uniref:hypothetical protein n=1 Tax=Cellulosimicrobium cellulans TaxID=1710 RepID=UPI0037F8BFA6